MAERKSSLKEEFDWLKKAFGVGKNVVIEAIDDAAEEVRAMFERDLTFFQLVLRMRSHYEIFVRGTTPEKAFLLAAEETFGGAPKRRKRTANTQEEVKDSQ